MKAEQLHVLQHSLGVDQYGRGRQYRNSFVTDPAGRDGLVCESLVALGLMANYGSGGDITGHMTLYRVTDAGKEAMGDASPDPPKLTRSQERYRRYLSADLGISFREWLKHEKRFR